MNDQRTSQIECSRCDGKGTGPGTPGWCPNCDGKSMIDTTKELRRMLGRAPLRPEWRAELEIAAVNALPGLLDIADSRLADRTKASHAISEAQLLRREIDKAKAEMKRMRGVQWSGRPRNQIEALQASLRIGDENYKVAKAKVEQLLTAEAKGISEARSLVLDRDEARANVSRLQRGQSELADSLHKAKISKADALRKAEHRKAKVDALKEECDELKAEVEARHLQMHEYQNEADDLRASLREAKAEVKRLRCRFADLIGPDEHKANGCCA